MGCVHPRASHPVWGYKNIKERGVGVSVGRLGGERWTSIVFKPPRQTGLAERAKERKRERENINGPRASACTFAMGRVHPHAREKWGACIRVQGEDGGACIHLHLGNGVRVSACTVKMGRVHPHAPLPWGACIRMHVKNGARASACKCENYPSHLRASACT